MADRGRRDRRRQPRQGRAAERRIRLTINGVELLDYTEPDETIPLKGMIALQIHGGLEGTIRYRNLRITELPAQRL